MGSDEIDLDGKRAAAITSGEANSPEASAPDSSGAVGELPGVSAAEGVTGSLEAGAITPNHAIAAGLASGALDPVAAQQLLIDQVLSEQLPPGIAPEQVERFRVELANLLANDPTLAALLQP